MAYASDLLSYHYHNTVFVRFQDLPDIVIFSTKSFNVWVSSCPTVVIMIYTITGRYPCLGNFQKLCLLPKLKLAQLMPTSQELLCITCFAKNQQSPHVEVPECCIAQYQKPFIFMTVNYEMVFQADTVLVNLVCCNIT